MGKITSLTKDQIEKFPDYIKKWTDIGLSTEPANRREAEDGIREAYKIAGLQPPIIIWCGSPLSNGLVRGILLNRLDKRDSVGTPVWNSVKDSVVNSVRSSIWNSVGNSVWDSVGNFIKDSVENSVVDSVWNSVGDSVGDSVWASVENSVWASVWNSVGSSVGNSVRDSVGNHIWNSVRDSVRDSVWDSGYGQHDASWLGFYEYFAQECSLHEETRKLEGLWKIAKNAGWFISHEEICFISERPNKLNRDEQGRLHSEEEVAISYPDGWSIYAWHGIRVPEDIILYPEKISIVRIEQESNQEIKRVMIERYGMGRYMEDSGCEEIHSDEFGILLSKKRTGMPDMRMVKVINGSYEGLWKKKADGGMEFTPYYQDGKQYRKEYFLRVPPHTKTALEGVASTYGMNGNEYKKIIKRT